MAFSHQRCHAAPYCDKHSNSDGQYSSPKADDIKQMRHVSHLGAYVSHARIKASRRVVSQMKNSNPKLVLSTDPAMARVC
jgi:hypothetical protein